MGKRIQVSNVTFIPSALPGMLGERNMLSFLFEKVMYSQWMDGKNCYNLVAKLDFAMAFLSFGNLNL